MDKKRLTGLIDAAFVLVAVHAVYNYIFYPNPRSWEGVWEMRHELYRTGVLLLWLAGLWTCAYRPWNAVKRVSQPAVLLGAGTALCVLGDYYFTGFIINSTVARFTHLLYGGWLMLHCAVEYALQWALARANGDVPALLAASKVWRRRLVAAFVILAAGELVCAFRLAGATRYFACLAALWLLGAALSDCFRRGEGN